MIVSGGEWPRPEVEVEPARQSLLRGRNAAVLARSFWRAGFVPVIDDVCVSQSHLAFYREQLADLPLHVVVLAPRLEVTLRRDNTRGYKRVGDTWAHLDETLRAELAGEGIWVDSSDLTVEETVAKILAGSQ
jgi:hypothetical protein